MDFEGFDILHQEVEVVEEAKKELKAAREAIIARKKSGEATSYEKIPPG